MTSPFFNPKLKISRGRHHIASLESEIANYLSRDPSALLLQIDRNTGQHRIAMKGREDIPDSFGPIFGDAVHNFRAALDILANELVSLSGSQPRKAYFPFADTADGLEDQIKQKMRGAAADIVNAIRALKPYRGGNETLRALHDLDISDKHISILQIASTGMTGALPMRQVSYERISGDKPNRIRLKADFSKIAFTPIDLTGFSPDPPGIETLGKMTGSSIEIAIAKGLPFAGIEAIKTLNGLGDIAKNIVETFETLCLRR
ncbi:MAG: hypothetical protein ABI439_00015 [Rhodospirillales bacterium]